MRRWLLPCLLGTIACGCGANSEDLAGSNTKPVSTDCDDTHSGCADPKLLAKWDSYYTDLSSAEYLSDTNRYYQSAHARESWRVYGVDYRNIYEKLFGPGGKYDSKALRGYLDDVQIYFAVDALRNVIVVKDGSLGGDSQARTSIVRGILGPQIGIIVEEKYFKKSDKELAKILLHEFGHAVTLALEINAGRPAGYLKQEAKNLKYIFRSEIAAEALAVALLDARRPDSTAYKEAKKWLEKEKEGYRKFGGRGVLVLEYEKGVVIPDVDEIKMGPGTDDVLIRNLKIEVDNAPIVVNPRDPSSVIESGICNNTPGIVCEFSPDGKLIRLAVDSSVDQTLFLPPDLAGKLDAHRVAGCSYIALTLAEYKRGRPIDQVLTLFFPGNTYFHLIPVGQVLGFENPGTIDSILASQPDTTTYFLVNYGINLSEVRGGGDRILEITVEPE